MPPKTGARFNAPLFVAWRILRRMPHTWRSPMLIHADHRNLDFSQTVELAVALRRQGVYFEPLIITDEIHGFLRHASWLRAYHAAVDFFQRKL